MKRLEETIGVELFDREKNKIVLNKTGQYTIKLAEELIQKEDEFLKKIKAIDKHNNTIYIKSCELGALFETENWIKKNYPEKSISSSLLSDNEIEKEIKEETCDIGILSYPTNKSKPFIEEKLFISVKRNHPLSSEKSIYFSQLDGMNFLSLKDIGYWEFLVKSKLPNSIFFTQQDINSYIGLLEASDLPIFCSNKGIFPLSNLQNRICIHTFHIVDQLKTNKYPPA